MLRLSTFNHLFVRGICNLKEFIIIIIIIWQKSSMMHMFCFTNSSHLNVDVAMVVNASILGVVARDEMQPILKLGQRSLIPVIL